jgi:hypothetical protein
MPEGSEIFLAARQVHEAVAGKEFAKHTALHRLAWASPVQVDLFIIHIRFWAASFQRSMDMPRPTPA